MKTPSKKTIKKLYLVICRTANSAYQQDLIKAMESCSGDYSHISTVMEELGQKKFRNPVRVGCLLVKDKTFTLDEIHNMAWEGFNGLMEADCVKANIQHWLGMSVDNIDVSKYYVTA